MAKPGSHLDLSQEPLIPEPGRQVGVENLQGDATMKLEILCQVDRGHAAATELALEGIAVAQGISEISRSSGHAAPQ
jgi:hypothetical protein